MFQISWTLTPQASTIINSFLEPSAPHTLIEMADSVANALAPWAATYLNAGYPLANIVIVDHFEATPAVSVAAQSSTLKFPPIVN